MDLSLLSNNDTPTSPGSRSEDSDDNLSSQSLSKIDEICDQTGELSVIASLADTISDKLSTGVIDDQLPYSNFISLSDEPSEDLEAKANRFRLNKERFASQYRQKGSPINKPTYSSSCKAVASCKNVRNVATKTIPVPTRKSCTVRIANDEKVQEAPPTSRSCPPSSIRTRKANFKNTGLLKPTVIRPVKPKQSAVTDEMVLSLQSKLTHEVARNKELTAELDRCQAHMREAAAAYVDLGKLAVMERERAEKAESKLKEALFRVKELELALENEKKRAIVGCCDATISSFVGDEMPSFRGESLDKIESSLKNVLNEMARFRQRRSRENDAQFQRGDRENVFEGKQKPPQEPLRKSLNDAVSKPRLEGLGHPNQRGRPMVMCSSSNAEDERGQELQRAVQHLISKRSCGPFRP